MLHLNNYQIKLYKKSFIELQLEYSGISSLLFITVVHLRMIKIINLLDIKIE